MPKKLGSGLLCTWTYVSYIGSLTKRARAGGYAGSNYPFLTQKERDIETGLDYFGARYYASVQGRFTSVDTFDVLLPRSGRSRDSERAFLRYIVQPAHWNKYTYVLNNPLRHVDPNGEQEQDLEPIANQALVNALSGYASSISLRQRIAIKVTRTILDWVFGSSPEVIPGRLAAHERQFAAQITEFTQSTFIGQASKNEPGIDGIMTAPGSASSVRGVASITETNRDNPRVLIDLAQDKESSAKNAGYSHVDLFIKATSLDSKTVVDYVNKGPAITDVASGNTIRSINIFTNDGKVVKVAGKSVTVCDNKGKCP